MAGIFSILLIISASILQVTLVTRITLLQAPADIVLLIMAALILQDDFHPNWRWGLLAGLILSLSSALPLWVLLVGYTASSSITYLLRKRVWQTPMLILFTSVLLGTLIIDGITMLYLWISASPFNLIEAINFIIIPRVIFNMLLAFPVFAIVGEMAKIFVPDELAQ